MADEDLLQSTHTFAITNGPYAGETVHKGDLIRKGHPIIKGREALFEPAQGYVRFEVEQTTAAPGEKRARRGTTRRRPAKKVSSASALKATDAPKNAGK